jgi:hypothetical protein
MVGCGSVDNDRQKRQALRLTSSPWHLTAWASTLARTARLNTGRSPNAFATTFIHSWDMTVAEAADEQERAAAVVRLPEVGGSGDVLDVALDGVSRRHGEATADFIARWTLPVWSACCRSRPTLLTARRLARALEEVLRNPRYRNAARAMQAALTREDGVANAAAEIVALA